MEEKQVGPPVRGYIALLDPEIGKAKPVIQNHEQF